MRFDVKHNHSVAPEHAKAYPRNRRLTPAQLAIVESVFQANPDSHAMKDFIEGKQIHYQFKKHQLLAETFHTPCTMSDVRNIKAKLKASSQAVASTPDVVVGGVLNENVEEDVLSSLPALSHDASLDDMATQLSSQLDHVQELVISSPNSQVFESRVKCLSRLIEVWEEDKEAVVLVPQHQVLTTTEPQQIQLVRLQSMKHSPGVRTDNNDAEDDTDVFYHQVSPEKFY